MFYEFSKISQINRSTKVKICYVTPIIHNIATCSHPMWCKQSVVFEIDTAIEVVIAKLGVTYLGWKCRPSLYQRNKIRVISEDRRQVWRQVSFGGVRKCFIFKRFMCFVLWFCKPVVAVSNRCAYDGGSQNGVKKVSVATGKPLQTPLVIHLLTTCNPHFPPKKRL